MNAFAPLAPLKAKLLDEQEDLAADLIEKIGWFRLDRVTSQELADEACRWLKARIDALMVVIEDERRKARPFRDHEWLDAANEVLAIASSHWRRVRMFRDLGVSG